MNKIIGKIGACIYCAAIVTATVYFTIRDADRNIIKDVTIEAGSQIKIEDFFKDCPEDARFVTDISGIDTNVPSIYMLKVFYDEAFEKDVTLRIEDHTAPKESHFRRTSMQVFNGLKHLNASDIFTIFRV